MMSDFNRQQIHYKPRAHSNQRHSRYRLAGLSVLALSLIGCNTIPPAQVGPVVAQPNVAIDQNYEVFSESATLPPSLAAQRWQSFYTEPKLQALIAIGLDNNKDIQQSILAIRRAQAQYQITDNQDLPTLNGSGGYTRSATNAVDKNPSGVYNVNLGLANYELDFWGKVASLEDQALQKFLATTAAKDTAQVSLIANIAKSYVALSYQLKQLELASKTLETRLESLRITRARLEAGIDSKAPSLQAEVAAEDARIAMLNAQSGVVKAKNALRLLIGTPVPDDLLPEPAVSNITTQEVLSPGLPSELLRYRPDILQAEYELKAAGANIDVARASYFPSISLTGRLGYSSSELGDLFDSRAAGWSFGPSISVPIFDAGQLDANYEVAQIEREQALLSYERSIETAFKEVSDVLADRATLDDRLESEYRLQDNYKEIFEISEARYIAQVDDYLSVLDTQRSLFNTQQRILGLEQERLINQIEMYQVLGGGANMVEPVAILQPQNPNLIRILTPMTDEQKAAAAIEAASSPSVISAAEAAEIKAQQPTVITDSKLTNTVHLNSDPHPDAYIVDINQTTIYPKDSHEEEANSNQNSETQHTDAPKNSIQPPKQVEPSVPKVQSPPTEQTSMATQTPVQHPVLRIETQSSQFVTPPENSRTTSPTTYVNTKTASNSSSNAVSTSELPTNIRDGENTNSESNLVITESANLVHDTATSVNGE